jgi:serine O-acetyltransferase
MKPPPKKMEIARSLRKKRQDFRSLIAFIREDYRTHRRDWTLPGFQAIAVYRFGIWTRTVERPRLLRLLLRFLYGALFTFVRNVYGIELSDTAAVGRRLEIGHQGGIAIHFLAKIGDDCLIHQNVTLGAATTETIIRAPTLCDRVEIGCGAAVIGNVVIGADARIGPNAVVTMSIPPGSTVVATPPRLVSVRSVRTNDSADQHHGDRGTGTW